MNDFHSKVIGRWCGLLLIAWMNLGLPDPAASQVPMAATPVAIPQFSRAHAPDAGPIGGPCDPYWIVSARDCRRQLECNQNCSFAVCRFDGPGAGRSSSLDELAGSLQPGVPVCIMVHGSFVQCESMLRDSAATNCWIRAAAPGRPVHTVFFTWPSDSRMSLLPNTIDTCNARRLGELAELNCLYLAELVSRVPEANPVCLIGHSHGARMVSATLHLLGGGFVQGRYFSGPMLRHRIRAILAAAAIDHDWFNPGQRYERAPCRAEVIVNLRNRHDFPLCFHPTRHLFARPALGRTGITPRDQFQLGPAACRFVEYDLTDVIGWRHVWPHYYCRPAVACLIRPYVDFDHVPLPL